MKEWYEKNQPRCFKWPKIFIIKGDGDDVSILEWHYWKDEKPRENRWTIGWHAKRKEYSYTTHRWTYSYKPTKWAYLPTQREMVGRN